MLVRASQSLRLWLKVMSTDGAVVDAPRSQRTCSALRRDAYGTSPTRTPPLVVTLATGLSGNESLGPKLRNGEWNRARSCALRPSTDGR